MPLTLLHTNDFHGSLTPEKARFLRELKERDDALYFDSGDLVKSGNLAIPVREEAAWGLIAEAGCDSGTLGNRETHVIESAFRAKLAGAKHPLLCANLFRRDGSLVLAESLILEKAGIRVGVFGVMVPMVTRKMATQAASAYLWEQPIPIAVLVAAKLRAECDLVIAITHIGFSEDQKLAESGAEIDVIFGGHSHTVLEAPVQHGKTWICQGGSHGRFVGRYLWEDGRLTGGLVPLSFA